MNSVVRGHHFSKIFKTRTSARYFATASPSQAPKTKTNTKTESSSLGGDNLSALLGNITERFEHRDALRNVKQKVRYTYKEIRKHVDGVGEGLLDGVAKPEHRILSLMGNEVENIISHIGMNRVGMTYIPASPHTSPKDLVGLLDRFQPKVVFLNARQTGVEELRAVFTDLIPNRQTSTLFKSERFPFLRMWVHSEPATEVVPMRTLKDLLSYDRFPSNIPKAVAGISGNSQSVVSFHNDKETVWTHAQVIRYAQAVGSFLGVSTGQRVGVSVPMHSHWAHAVAIWPVLMNGGVVTTTGSFPENPEKLWEALEVEHAESWIADLPSFEALVKLGRGFPSHLKKVLLVHSGPVTSEAVKGASSLGEIAILDPWAEKVTDAKGKTQSLF